MGAPLVYPLRVRYAECDAQEVVFNAHYLAYFDASITELWRAAFGGYGTMLERGFDVVVAEAHLRFLDAARFDDVLDLEVGITRLGTTGISEIHRARRGPALLVEGTIRHVVVRRGTGEKAPMPEWMRTGLEPFLVEEG